MLVITRKTGEGFLVGDDVKITILEVGKDRIRIGIDAPKDVKIVRNEIADTEELNIKAAEKLPAAFMAELLKNRNN